MDVSPETLTLEEAQELIEDTPQWYDDNKLFLEGEHWQDGDGWVGPMPNVFSQDDVYSRAFKQVEKNFASQNVIAEVVERHTSGVVGRETHWTWTPDDPGNEDQESALSDRADQANQYSAAWWKRRGLAGFVLRVVREMLVGEYTNGRLFINGRKLRRAAAKERGVEPQNLETSDGTVPVPSQLSFEQALDLVHVDHVSRQAGNVYRNPQTHEKIGVHIYQDPATEEPRAEITYIDADGLTVVRFLDASGETGRLPPMDLGGNLTHYRVERLMPGPYITQQIRQQQKLLNKAHTMKSTNLDWSAFIERIFLNAEMPGEWVSDSSAPGGERFQPDPLHMGPDTANFIAGLTYRDRDGNERIADPDVFIREPSSTDLFDNAINGAYMTMLREARQLHAMQGYGANVSGEAIRQHMADYLVSLLLTAPAAKGFVKWLVETAMYIAVHFSGEPQVTENLRLSTEIRLNPGPIPASEIDAIINLVRNNLLARASGMSRVGVEDIEDELNKLREDAVSQLQYKQGLSEVVERFVKSGMSLHEALLAAGVPEEDADMLSSYQVPSNGVPR